MGFCKTDLCCTLKYEPTVSLCWRSNGPIFYFVILWKIALLSFPKAQQSRQKFLNEHMVKVDKDAIKEENGDEAEQADEKDVSSSEIRKWEVK